MGRKVGELMTPPLPPDVMNQLLAIMSQLNDPLASESPDSILAATSYRPEYSWNYELGFKGELVKNRLQAEAAVFFIDARDIQITDFVESGQGRLLKNAGRAHSIGFDLGLTAYPINNLSLSANYGYAHATFKDYTTKEKNEAGEIVDKDYSGNYIPFAPQNTFSISAGYSHGLRSRCIIDRFNIHVQYKGAGKIYWTEANDVFQNFYGVLNMKAGVSKGIFKLDVWAKNMLNTNYAAFYFKTGGRELAQRGVPFQMGIDLTVAF